MKCWSHQLHMFKFCVHEAFEVISESSPNGRQRTRFYLFTPRKAALPRTQIPLTSPNRLMNVDADILNGLESKMDSSHATARPSRRPACCLEGLSRVWTPWTSSVYPVPSSDGRMGPGNSAECAGEWATRCKVVSSMENKETKTESRSNRIRRRESRSRRKRGSVPSFRRQPPSVTRADGRAYGGRVCLGVSQGVHDIRE